MNKNRYEILDNDPWYKNHPSPMAKWLANLSFLGFCWFGQTGGIIWFILFNPMIVILYIAAFVVFTIMLLN